ncbi:C4-dicarboxylic acid transporter DauA [Zhongshania aliphaticivorans]|uniref:C4-dicarboxylic acid transporter DauA n=1 Tax=Zhongshania aliphaticivorans TaxID=1470434 RepID=A0A5S9Q9T3_9GAMM|nr:C4-dicarboxylic acid transporter DauA [Zhongshania aliphaticivorans]CAA0102299.1 C4-dicarboxylic acid transporter DauA [Zhongshania aliphaticivorans]CAA0114413.1 C4-dicarboxylic acid transporter DauA [Zhongshania aliphaticivorans]
MTHRAHLFSLKMGFALREALTDGYKREHLLKDVIAGMTVGIIAIPLAMALAIASGVAPQYGLYTAFIAGAMIALTGGSRFSISGPTAAFVVILHPLAAKYGLAGLLLASLMAGGILIVMAYAKLGRFIEYIPESVTLGFTGGIAIVIAVLQITDFTGLQIHDMPEHFLGKLSSIAGHFSQIDMASSALAIFTLAIMMLWPRLRTPVPPHLPALIFSCLLGVLLNSLGAEIDTIGSRFHYLLPDGSSAPGIPPYLPTLEWPWNRPGPDGQTLTLSLSLISELLPAAFAIAMLGAIESLLCAVVLDGMSGKRHSANSELLGQGIGNILTPFFGGVTATAAIARSATNFKVGAVSPIAAIVHALVVLLGLLVLSSALAYIPMPAMAAMLMVVAWNMSEAGKSISLIKTAPLGDILVLLTCLSLTVFFDMVIAISVGIVLASLLFMKEIASLTDVVDITTGSNFINKNLDSNVKVLKIRGPLFFAAADRIVGEISQQIEDIDELIIYMKYSAYLDAGGLSAIKLLLSQCEKNNTKVRFASWQFQPLKTLAKTQKDTRNPLSMSFATLDEAIDNALMETTAQ